MINRIIKNFELIVAAQTIKTQGRGIKADNRRLYGIDKLRGLILELAVMGKLVPQDPEDEPASKLLNRKTLILSDEEILYQIPEKWEWCRLEEIGTTNIGLTYSPKDITQDGIPVLRSNNIQRGQISLSELVRVTTKVDDKVLVSIGDLLICARNGSANLVGKCALINDLTEKMAFGAFMAIFRSQYNKYIKCFIESPIYRKNLEGVNTTTINQITQSNLKNTLIPLPPLNEQNRIVAKVDELMALCDQLEKEQTGSNTAHEILVETLLDTLTSASGPAELEPAWQRISDHFELLFTTEYSIDRLKQTILQLAVMGKLVEQDPDDEPASELLKRIKKEKERLVKEGKIKNQNHLPEIDNKIIPYELPIGWIWSRIGDISLSTEYGLSDMTFEGINGVPVLKMGDIQDGKALLGGQKIVPKNVEGLPSLYLKKGDLLYNRTNSAELVGKTGIFDGTDDEYTFASYLIRIRCSVNCVNPKYLNFSMNAPLFRITQIEPHLKQQCGQANVNGTILKNMIVPIPPSNEQQRIVAKVNELFGICDALKERIREAQGIERDLAEEMIEHGNVH